MYAVMRTFYDDRMVLRTAMFTDGYPSRELAKAAADTLNKGLHRRPVHPELVAVHGLQTPPDVFEVVEQ